LEEDKEKVLTFCMKGTETQKPSPLLLVLEAEEKGILRLASLSLTFKVTAWLPLLPEFSAMASSRHKKRECKRQRESRKSRERRLLTFGKEPQQSNCYLLVQKGPKIMGEREKWTFLRRCFAFCFLL
jgi:hypothetical protein